MNLRWVVTAMAVAAVVALQSAVPVNGQIPTSPCTASMLTSFTPCINFLTNNTANMTTPTPGCCSSLMSLASNSSGCLCQILTGGSPFPVPVNRTTAISLPKSCNMAGVPVQCNLASPTIPPSSAPGISPLAPLPGLSPLPAAPAAPAPAPTTSSASTAPTSSPVGAPVSAITPTLAAPTSPTTTTVEPPAAATGNAAKTSNPTASAALALSPPLLLLPLLLLLIKFY